MKHIFLTMALGASICLMSAQAFSANAGANANSGSSSGAQSSASGGAGGASYAGAGASANGYNNGQGQQMGLNYNPVDNSVNNVDAADLGDSVPGVFSAGVTAGGSNPCIVSVGGGASGSGFGINFARAYNDGECQIRESLRLMVAILPNNNDQGSQMLIRETACQSDVYWQSMERVYLTTKDERFLCTNPRPDNKPIAIRDRAAEKVEVTSAKAPALKSQVVSNYNSHPFLDF